MVSSGWQVQASTRPAEPPATRCVIRVLGLVSDALLIVAKVGKEVEERKAVSHEL